MTEDYKLPPEVHDAICEEIKKGLFDGKEPVSNPQIFILGGQPGAGKSVLTKRVYENFGSFNRFAPSTYGGAYSKCAF